MITRRSFLASLGALAGAAACRNAPKNGTQQAATDPKRRLDRIGIQLYTVRQQMRADMPGTVARIAQLGYKEVEFAGYFGRSPADVRAMLASNGLSSPSTHIGYDAMAANWDKTFDDALAIGHQFVTVPSPPNNTAKTADAWRTVADNFNKAAERAKARGLGFAYHNHYTEFQPVDGGVPFDILLANADPNLVQFQMDVFWAVRGGADPKALIQKHPARFVMLHIKDSGGAPTHTQVDIGAGSIDFAGILRQDLALRHVVKHVFIEHDQPADPMLFAKAGFDYLSKLEY